jgi:hypothetical protein
MINTTEFIFKLDATTKRVTELQASIFLLDSQVSDLQEQRESLIDELRRQVAIATTLQGLIVNAEPQPIPPANVVHMPPTGSNGHSNHVPDGVKQDG